MNRRVVGTTLLSAWLLSCAIASYRQVPVWHSNLTLWEHAVRVYPQHPSALVILGSAYLKAGQFVPAIQVLEHAYVVVRTSTGLTESKRCELQSVIASNFVSLYRMFGDTAKVRVWQKENQPCRDALEPLPR